MRAVLQVDGSPDATRLVESNIHLVMAAGTATTAALQRISAQAAV
jgi:hypothetical protein